MRCKLLISCLAAFLFSALCISSYLIATVIAKGDSSDDFQTFTKAVQAKVYNRATGTIYLAVGDGAETNDAIIKDDDINDKIVKDKAVKDGNQKKAATKQNEEASYRLTKATRLVGNQKPIFIPIGQNVGTDIRFLAIATRIGDTSPYLAYTEFTTTDTPTQRRVNIVKDDGTSQQFSNELLDASVTTPLETCGIVALAANKSFIFAAVRPWTDGCQEGDPNQFGDQDSGIAVVCINPRTLELRQTPAAGGTTIRAKKLDLETSVVKIANDVTFVGAQTPDLFWDHQLERLYIGLELLAGDQAGDGVKAVVVARVNCCGVMTFSNIAAPNTVFSGATDKIVGAIGADEYVSIKHVRVMHCSTGPSYLIVNGGNGHFEVTNNTVYAMPLVDNPSNVQKHGTLANKNSPLQNFKFVTQATTPAHLLTNTEQPAMVGAGPLPIDETTPISDMVVVGDTVYVSIAGCPDSNNDAGVLYSEALFDETGKIVRWTPWTKRALPYKAFPNVTQPQNICEPVETSCCCTGVAFFEVDAVTGKLWAVDGCSRKAVCSTAWDFGTTPQSLPTQLNNVFNRCPCNRGSFSVLDLDQSTRGFTSPLDQIITTSYRYALFGGADTVVFAHISTSTYHNLNTPQTVIEDFTNPENFLVTYLPPCSGCVHVLEYSRRPISSQDNSGYFFAGTEKGLFAFADSQKAGFNVQDLQNLNQPPFKGGQWYHIPSLKGTAVDIKTIGNRLYVITFETSCETPLKSRLYGIYFAGNLDTMFAAGNLALLAESGIGKLNNALLFRGMEVVATGDRGVELFKNQLILATNNGLFRSCADQAVHFGIFSAQNQTDADWRRLPTGNTKPYWGITAPDARIPSTVWPLSLEDRCGQTTLDGGSVQQISITGTTGCENPAYDKFVPPNFIALSNTFEPPTLDPVSHFWSDGARRFFVITPPMEPFCINKLLSFPYNTLEWNIMCHLGPYIIFDPVVFNTKRFYWVHQIGMSGILMVGTDSGVIALE